jgi:anti-anti-sigma factor
MTTQPFSLHRLKLQLEQKLNETIVHCDGKITTENSEVFQREIRDLIPESHGQIAAKTYRIVLDLSNVTHVDSAGLGALLGAWTAAIKKGCDLEIANLNPRVEKLVEITRLDTVFKRSRVVAVGGSTAAMPVLGDAPTELEPEEAYQQAFEAGMVVHRAHPLNCETSIPALIGGAVMPNQRFYIRNHFPIPQLDATNWRLDVAGLVERPLSLSLRDLVKMPSQTEFVTLECAGNGRSELNPRVDGEQWNLGAVSTAEWTGVPLAEVLNRAGVKTAAREVVFRGADSGKLDGSELIRFERSLSLDEAQGSGGLLAYAMNGEALPIAHGYPLRVIVPGWYAVASVKWLTQIDVISDQFSGHYQTESYFYEWQRGGQPIREPVSQMRVRSLITEPEPESEVEQGELPIRGVSWSGAAPIARVEVSVGGGPWQYARLMGEPRRYSWQGWELIARLEQPGSTVIAARATDMAGRTQPDSPEWNRLGYGNNVIQKVRVDVR